MIIIFGLIAMFFLGIVCGALLHDLYGEKEVSQPEVTTNYGYHDMYTPMQDTSDKMYNKHGVHKHNPMLDR